MNDMWDVLIRGGLVVDGTGAAARHADVAIRDGRIQEVGAVDGEARQTIDAAGLVVAPGFIDIHTHYDAQLHWDGCASPSSQHGVTTVIGGNCGFTLAPLKARDADYTRRMMAQVEGMPLAALETGIEWTWETFDEYLGSLEGRVAVNAGFLVGHCALRRYVLGEESLERESTESEVAALVALLHECLDAGGLGLSTTRSTTHPDHNGQPVPSRQASEAELLALCRAVGEHDGTTLEAIVSGCVNRFDEHEIELLAQMSAQANRPLNWNVLGVQITNQPDGVGRERVDHQLQPSVRAREIGGRVLALTLPTHGDLNMSMATYCAMWMIPGWRDVMTLPPREKTAKLRDPQVRAQLIAAAKGTGGIERFANLGAYFIGETVAAENKVYEGRLVADIAEERGVDPWDALIDIEEADGYQTVLWPQPVADEDEDWEVRRELWESEDVVIGGSDAGAHLDRLLGAPYPTRFLADVLRGRKLVSLEEAVELMTDKPARLYGLTGRGRIAPGGFADVVVFDPASVDAAGVRRVYDLPGDSMRLTAASAGIEHVLVNGVETIRDGEPTGAPSGTVLRSGRDTETVRAR